MSSVVRMCILLIFLSLTFNTLRAQEDTEVEPDPRPTEIRLSYFDAVEDGTAARFIATLMEQIATYDLTLTLVELETGDPLIHVLFRPAAPRPTDTDSSGQPGGITTIVNLFETPLETVSHALRPVPFERAVAFAAPPEAAAHMTLALALFAAGYIEEAAPQFEALTTEDYGPPWSLTLSYYSGLCALLLEDYESAAAFFAAVIPPPDDTIAWPATVNLAYIDLQNAEIDAARARLDAMMDSVPEWSTDYADALTRRAVLLGTTGEVDTALTDLNLALATDPQYGPAYYERGVLLHVQGDTAAAAADLTRYLELMPDGPYADEARLLLRESVDS
ncbi:MAG: tetratricopeptide repeat protein [Chloroflexota bacterium]